jgi:hypothetical protein
MGWERLSELFRTFAEFHDALTKTFGLLLWDGNVCLTCLGPLILLPSNTLDYLSFQSFGSLLVSVAIILPVVSVSALSTDMVY